MGSMIVAIVAREFYLKYCDFRFGSLVGESRQQVEGACRSINVVMIFCRIERMGWMAWGDDSEGVQVSEVVGSPDGDGGS